MSYGQHFFIRARPGAVRQPDCKAVLLRQRSLTGLGWHGPFARHQAATGDEATETFKRVRTADQLSRGCTHRRDRYRDPALEVKLCAACRIQQVVCKSSRSKRRGARCTGDRVGVLSNGSMHQDVPASTFGWCSSPVACAQQAVHRYCLNLRPSGAGCPHTRNPVGHVQGWPVPALSRQE